MRDLVHPDYWQIVEARVDEMLETGKPQPVIEEKFVRLDGTEIDVEVAAVPVIQEGETIGAGDISRHIGSKEGASCPTAAGHSGRTGSRGYRHNRSSGEYPIRQPGF